MLFCPFQKETKNYAADGRTLVSAKDAMITKESLRMCLGSDCAAYSQDIHGCALCKKPK